MGQHLLIKPSGNLIFPRKTSAQQIWQRRNNSAWVEQFRFLLTVTVNILWSPLTYIANIRPLKAWKQWQLRCYHRETLLRSLWVTLSSPCLNCTGGSLLLGQMCSNCYQFQWNPHKHQRWKQAWERETFEETEDTVREFRHVLQLFSGIYLRDGGSKHVSTTKPVSAHLEVRTPVDNWQPEALLCG